MEIKIFNNFGDIEAKYETIDILAKFKKDNTGIEQKELFKQNKKYKFQKQVFISWSFRSIL